jgi:beta-lysine 5,6-aminomutase alpha subunit
MNTMADFSEEIEFKADGVIVQRAHKVLDETIDFLEKIEKVDLFNAVEQGMFAEVKRPKKMGKGFDGVVKRATDYWNPFETFLKSELGIET